MATDSTTDTTTDSEPVDTLLKGLKNDEDQDTRKCPHNCHGELSVVEDGDTERVLCQSCRCTPEGIYYDPDDSTTPEVGFQAFAPNRDNWDRGLEWRRSDDRERYRNSDNVKMVGGFEEAWPQEKTSGEDSII